MSIDIFAKHVSGVLFSVQFNNFAQTQASIGVLIHALTLAARSYALLSLFCAKLGQTCICRPLILWVLGHSDLASKLMLSNTLLSADA